MTAALCPADLRRAEVPGQLALHGARAVYTVRAVGPGGERTDLWAVGLDGSAPHRLTESPGTDHTPRISRLGVVAFLRAGPDGIAQAHVLDDDRPSAVTRFARGVHDLVWYPDGDALVVLAEDHESPETVGDPDDPTAIVLRRRDWRADGEGDRLHPRHLHRVTPDGTTTRLTAGPWSASRPRVAADGTVHFVADLEPDADLRVPRAVYRLAPEPEPVIVLAGRVLRYHLDPVRVLGTSGPADHEPPRWHDEHGTPLAADLDRWSGLLGDETDLHEWALELDDAAGLTTLSDAGDTVPATPDDATPLVDVPCVTGAVAADGRRRVAVLSFGLRAPDLYELGEAGPRRLTTHGDWLAAFAQPRPSTIEVAGAGGTITVHLLRPPDGRGGRGPGATVLLVHGGPTGQWATTPTIEALLLAAAGYTVAMPNIRGSLDRGPAWVAALGGRWGGPDAADCHAVLDHLVDAGVADPARLGVSGLSYGGFLTQWLVATSDRFAAAVSENGVSNQVSAWGNCADGPTYCAAAGLGDPIGSPEQLWATSPLAHVAGVHTPLLMLQGDDDRTCPAADNEQFFVALRTLHRDVEYVRYPGESHLMQATGRLDRRIDRHTRVLAWFGKHLPT